MAVSLRINKHSAAKAASRQRRQVRGRKKIFGVPERPRLVVTRSAKHISAQVIDDVAGRTLASASTMEADLRSSDGDKSDKAKSGRCQRRRAGQGRRRRAGRLRPRRQQVPRTDRGAGRRLPAKPAWLLTMTREGR